MAMTRRHLLQGGAVAAMAPALGLSSGLPAIDHSRSAQTAPAGPLAARLVDLFGDLKYPAGFKRFDYVNPDAPKGGAVAAVRIGTFDNFNIAVVGVEGLARTGAGLIFETLMERSQDEVVDRLWLARGSRRYPDDFSW